MADAVAGPGANELAVEILRLLTASGQTVAAAESLTGGLLAAALTDVPGSSAAFRGGVVAYAPEVKASVLGVDAPMLAEHGPVYAPVAAAMADGVRKLLGATIGVATTGVAGPGPADGWPAGTVHIAVSLADDTVVRTMALAGNRAEVRRLTVERTLGLLLGRLREAEGRAADITALRQERTHGAVVSRASGTGRYRGHIGGRAQGPSGGARGAVLPQERSATMVLLRQLLGDVLRRLRIRQGRTLREVSASARVSLGYLSEVERGRKEASSELLAAICAALETPLSQVFREVSDNFAFSELQNEPMLGVPREPGLRVPAGVPGAAGSLDGGLAEVGSIGDVTDMVPV